MRAFKCGFLTAQAFIGLCDAAEGRVEPGLTAALDASIVSPRPARALTLKAN